MNLYKKQEGRKIIIDDYTDQTGVMTGSEAIASGVKSLIEIGKSGFRKASPDVVKQRRSICNSCQYWEPSAYGGLGRCAVCKCSGFKLDFATSRCPKNKWPTVKAINVLAYLDNQTGLSVVGIEVVRQLIKRGWFVNVVAQERGFDSRKLPDEVSARITYSVKPALPTLHVVSLTRIHEHEVRSHDIVFSMWESSLSPPSSVERLNKAALVITPTHWNRTVFIESGVTCPIEVVPLGVDNAMFTFGGYPSGPFVFLCAGKMTHGGPRKGIEDVISAFNLAFPNERDVRLRIKIHKDCELKEPDDLRIDVIRHTLTLGELRDWYCSGHVFVSAARGEGWGLHQHQAMSCARPVIAAPWAGLGAFIDDHCSYPCGYELDRATGFYEGRGVWAMPDVGSIASRMRECYTDRERVAAIGKRALSRACMLSWDNSGHELATVLNRRTAKTISKQRNRTFYHAGDIGDVIHSIPTIESLGGGILYLGKRCDLEHNCHPRDGISRSAFAALRDLLLLQPCIKDVIYSDTIPDVDYDLNWFRGHWKGWFNNLYRRVWQRNGWTKPVSLQWMHLAAWGIDYLDETKPWLTVDGAVSMTWKDVIFHRTERSNNSLFPWGKVREKYGDRAVFVGFEHEHEHFEQRFGKVDYYPTDTLLDLARIIAGSRLMVCNTSAPHAIAEGMKKPILLECRTGDEADNVFDRPDLFCCQDGRLDPPDIDGLAGWFREHRSSPRSSIDWL